MTPQTTFNGLSPWAGLHVPSTRKEAKEKKLAPRKAPPKAPGPMPHKVKPKQVRVIKPRQINNIEITDDKPTKPIEPACKYQHLFEKLQAGQALKVKRENLHAVDNSLRDWVRVRKLGWKISRCSDYGDGYGRIFRIE